MVLLSCRLVPSRVSSSRTNYRINCLNAEVREVRTGALLTAIFLLLLLNPAYAQEEPATATPGLIVPQIIGTWDLPGSGAGKLCVNPSDGSVWTFLHQSGELVALNGTTGEVILSVALELRPTALCFAPDGSVVYLVGEPLDDQTINEGIIQAVDPVTGQVISETKVEGACNAVYAADKGILYVASGMQYAYQGTVYKLQWDSVSRSITVEAETDCGKIPWAIAVHDDVLFVTDLELQWTAQADGTMGPPYGSWVWEYNAGTLEFLNRSWVGINPNRLGIVNGGVLVGCSGSKQSIGDAFEPTLNLIGAVGESTDIFIGSTGASDLDVAADGSFAVVTLADWSPPVVTSGVGLYTALVNPEGFPEAKRWIYTGDVAVVDFTGDEPVTERYNIVTDKYLRSVALSPDGKTLYVLQDEPEKILAVSLGG